MINITHERDVLILDEPTTGLDPDQRYQLHETLRDLVEDIAARGGQVLVVNGGSLCNSGSTAQLAMLGERAVPRENDMRTRPRRDIQSRKTFPRWARISRLSPGVPIDYLSHGMVSPTNRRFVWLSVRSRAIIPVVLGTSRA